jgi:uncharacterized BrkB/YihY/UPF0761 family membrane protein
VKDVNQIAKRVLRAILKDLMWIGAALAFGFSICLLVALLPKPIRQTWSDRLFWVVLAAVLYTVFKILRQWLLAIRDPAETTPNHKA